MEDILQICQLVSFLFKLDFQKFIPCLIFLKQTGVDKGGLDEQERNEGQGALGKDRAVRAV